MLPQVVIAASFVSMLGAAPPQDGSAPSQQAAVRRGTTQLQLDLFDFLSPGYGAWVNHVRHHPDGRPRWQLGIAGGSFNRYERGERRKYGWGHAQDQRFYGRLAAAGYVWRGLYLGGQAEFMVRRARQRITQETRTRMFPTLQPAIGYNLHPWGWGRGRVSLMLWVAPRIILIQQSITFSDGASLGAPGWVEFASGLNLGVDL